MDDASRASLNTNEIEEEEKEVGYVEWEQDNMNDYDTQQYYFTQETRKSAQHETRPKRRIVDEQSELWA